MFPAPWQTWLDTSLTQWSERGLLRVLHPTVATESAVDVMIRHDVRDSWLAERSASSLSAGPSSVDPSGLHSLRLFSLNDYIGLSSHERVRRAAADSAARYGMGPRSSAIVAGYSHEHRQLETGLADLKGAEDCLLFPTGFAANMAAVAALCADGDTAVFSDELNHASIIDGTRLASKTGAEVHVYRHNDMAHLDHLLSSCPKRRKLVITDSLFSMDGDFADLKGTAELKKRHGFLWAVDEAHATLVCGENGAGAAEMQGVAGDVDLHIGTLSKAFGAQGGFIATSRSMKDWLQNRGRSFVYSTSLPVPVVVAASEALKVSHDEPWRRTHLWNLVRRLGSQLGIEAESPIIPVIVGSEANAVSAMSHFLRNGLHVPAIRPPTVPQGTCRLRISLSAAHTVEDIDELARLTRQLDMPLMSLSEAQGRRAQGAEGRPRDQGTQPIRSKL